VRSRTGWPATSPRRGRSIPRWSSTVATTRRPLPLLALPPTRRRLLPALLAPPWLGPRLLRRRLPLWRRRPLPQLSRAPLLLCLLRARVRRLVRLPRLRRRPRRVPRSRRRRRSPPLRCRRRRLSRRPCRPLRPLLRSATCWALRPLRPARRRWRWTPPRPPPPPPRYVAPCPALSVRSLCFVCFSSLRLCDVLRSSNRNRSA
jgi:hypothetical protein